MDFKVGKEYELYDIGEAITPQTIRHKVADNVEYVLKRERLLPRGYSVVIPMAGDQWAVDDDGSLQYRGDFEVFAPDHDTIVAYGQVDGFGLEDELSEITARITEVVGPLHKAIARTKRPKKKSSKRSSSTPTSMRGMR